MAIIPVMPAHSNVEEDQARNDESGDSVTRRTFGMKYPSRRTFGRLSGSRRTFGIYHP
jgi:hypothetical protein